MNEDQREEFIGTVVRLMRLTRENKITWRRERPRSDATDYAPTLVAEVSGLRFQLEDARRRVERADLFGNVDEVMADALRGRLSYRLVISEQEANKVLVSPPMQAASDLAAIVERHLTPEVKLSDVNRRLDEVL